MRERTALFVSTLVPHQINGTVPIRNSAPGLGGAARNPLHEASGFTPTGVEGASSELTAVLVGDAQQAIEARERATNNQTNGSRKA
jgi:hypothetical protein